MAEQKRSKRVRTLLITRLEQATPHKAAVRRAVGLLAMPGNSLVAARCTARTVDAIWAAAGDTSADFSWYTKRAILAYVYTSTLLFWLDDRNSLEETTGFIDRRLADVAALGKFRARLTARFAA
jgi:ubiquinone biosynthesis protein COQ9